MQAAKNTGGAALLKGMEAAEKFSDLPGEGKGVDIAEIKHYDVLAAHSGPEQKAGWERVRRDRVRYLDAAVRLLYPDCITRGSGLTELERKMIATYGKTPEGIKALANELYKTQAIEDYQNTYKRAAMEAGIPQNVFAAQRIRSIFRDVPHTGQLGNQNYVARRFGFIN